MTAARGAPAQQRQECFLNVATWQALIEHAGFLVSTCERSWLGYLEQDNNVSVQGDASWIATSQRDGWAPIALLHATPG